jgi:hypothetical protein
MYDERKREKGTVVVWNQPYINPLFQQWSEQLLSHLFFFLLSPFYATTICAPSINHASYLNISFLLLLLRASGLHNYLFSTLIARFGDAFKEPGMLLLWKRFKIYLCDSRGRALDNANDAI